jgi:hypothetical protein
MYLSIACLFIHISSSRSSCTSSQQSSHAPLHSMPIHSLFLITFLMHLLSSFFSFTLAWQAYSFTFPQQDPHAPPLSILFMHLSIACIFIPYSTACAPHAPLHSMPIHSHLLSTLLMHLSISCLFIHIGSARLSAFFSCTSPYHVYSIPISQHVPPHAHPVQGMALPLLISYLIMHFSSVR